MDFIAQEKSTICLFFGVLPADKVFELSEFYTLGSGSVDNSRGDRLEVLEAGIVVFINAPYVPPHYFQRDFAGLVAALEYMTIPES